MTSEASEGPLQAPLVSVVMPALNAAATIEASVSSVLGQTMPDLELVVVDDGSTDATCDIVRSFGDDRITVLLQDHAGAAAARNAGIRSSRGALIALVDSDDLLLPRFLERTTALLADHPDAGFAFVDAYVMSADSGRIRRSTAIAPYLPPVVPSMPEAFHISLLKANFIYNAVLLRRDVWELVGPFDETLRAAIDYEMWLRIAAHGYRGVQAVGQPLALYRSGRTGSISSNRERVLSQLVRVFEMSIDTHPSSEAAQAVARGRLAGVEAELAAVRGARTPDAYRRRLRDRLASLRSRARERSVWYPPDAPPPELEEALPQLLETVVPTVAA